MNKEEDNKRYALINELNKAIKCNQEKQQRLIGWPGYELYKYRVNQLKKQLDKLTS